MDRLLSPTELGNVCDYYHLEETVQSLIDDSIESQDAKTAAYYQTVIIPAKLTEATLELCEKYENDIIPQKIEEVVNEIEELRNHCGCGCKNDNSPECEYRFMSIYCRAYGLWKHSKYYSQESGA
jgi:hypothetical protein